MITSEEIRAAMAVFKWSRRELSEKTGLSARTIQRIVEGTGYPSTNSKNLVTLENVFNEGTKELSVEFLADKGIVIHFKLGVKND